jgi:hypothetical protein
MNDELKTLKEAVSNMQPSGRSRLIVNLASACVSLIEKIGVDPADPVEIEALMKVLWKNVRSEIWESDEMKEFVNMIAQQAQLRNALDEFSKGIHEILDNQIGSEE